MGLESRLLGFLLAGTEEGVDEVYPGAEEGHVGHGVLGGVLGAFPEAGALDVHSDIVVLRKPFRQGDGVLSLAAAQFQDYRAVIAEDFSAPVSLQRVVLVQHLVHRGLDEAAECLVFLEFTYLVLSHILF